MSKLLTIKDLIDHLIDLQATHGIPSNTPIWYSHDDEGNQYQYCCMLPSITYTKTPASYWGYIEDPSSEPIGERFICIN